MQPQSAHSALDLPAEVALQGGGVAEEMFAPLRPAPGCPAPALATLRGAWINLRGKAALPTWNAGQLRGVFSELGPQRRCLSHLYLIRDQTIPVFVLVQVADERAGRRRNIADLIRRMKPRPGDTIIAVMDGVSDPATVLHGLRMV